MDIWKILGIEATKDKDKLKKAYRSKLVMVNPEDDPDGFMSLREAYEEAIKLADVSDDAESEGKDSDILKAIKAVYSDFYKRIDEEAWYELFNSDYFVALDSAEEAFNTLLIFLMGNFFVPRKILDIIIDIFDIKNRKTELSETYPEDFIEYMLETQDPIDYYAFEGDEKQFDEYIDKHFLLTQAVRKHDIENQVKVLKEIEELDVYHPYIEVWKIRHKIQVFSEETQIAGEDDRLFEIKYQELKALYDNIREVSEKKKDDIFIINCCGDLALIIKEFDLAKQHYDRALELSPDNYNVKGKLADWKFCTGNYKESRDMYLELLKINHYDNNARAGMIRANSAIIQELNTILEDNPDDNVSRLELVWCLYQSYRFEEAITNLNQFDPDEKNKFEYHNVKGRTYLCLGQYEKALKDFMIWKAAIEGIPDDDESEDSKKKRKRYEYVNFLIADCYLKTERYEEARKYLQVALRKEHEEIELSYEARCELEYKCGDFEACIKACNDLLEKEKTSYNAYCYLAKSCFELDLIKETMDACERAINVYPYVFEPYEQEIKVYLKFNQTDGAKSVIQRFKALGINTDNMKYYDALILEREEKYNEAISTLKALIRDSEYPRSDMEDFSEAYMLLGLCYEHLGNNNEAKQYYKRVIDINPKHMRVYGRYSILQKEEGQYNEALKLMNKQIEIHPISFYFIHRGILNRYTRNYHSAVSDFQEALKQEPMNDFCYRQLGLIYEQHRHFEKAIEQYDKAIEFDNGEDSRRKAYVYSCKARALQCMKKFDESRSIYLKYFELFGLDADVAYDYSELLQRMNRFEEAVDILKKCIDTLEYDDNVQSCIRQLCSIYGNEGYLDKANECLNLAVSKNSSDCRIYAIMGEILKNHGRLDDARDNFERAVQLDIDNQRNYYSELIEVILSKRTLFKPDIKDFIEKAVIQEKEIKGPIDYIKMARLYRVTRKFDKAMKMVNMCLDEKRCGGCYYRACHEALYEKGLIYETLKNYDMARKCYLEALEVCGHNAVYEERLKRLENK